MDIKIHLFLIDAAGKDTFLSSQIYVQLEILSYPLRSVLTPLEILLVLDPSGGSALGLLMLQELLHSVSGNLSSKLAPASGQGL